MNIMFYQLNYFLENKFKTDLTGFMIFEIKLQSNHRRYRFGVLIPFQPLFVNFITLPLSFLSISFIPFHSQI